MFASKREEVNELQKANNSRINSNKYGGGQRGGFGTMASRKVFFHLHWKEDRMAISK